MNRFTFGSTATAKGSGIPRPSSIARSSSIPVPDSSKPRAFSTVGNNPRISRAPESASKAGPSSARKSIFLSAKKSQGIFGQTPQTKRASAYPSSVTSSAGRRSSIGGQRVTGEDRPITELSYQKQCVEKLNMYLDEIGHPRVNPKFVTSPSSNEIRKVFEILFSQMGVALESLAPQGKPWDSDIGNVVRSLGYRYPIAKKNLAINSTTNNARGQLFGLIEWLVDKVSYATRVDGEKVMGKELEENFGYHFLDMALDDPENCQKKWIRLEERFFPTKENFKLLAVDKQQLIETEKAIEKELDEFVENEGEVEKATLDIKRQDEYIEQMEKRREFAESEKFEIREAIAQVSEVMAEKEIEKKRTQVLIENQHFDKKDLELAKEMQKQLNAKMQECTREHDEIRQKMRDLKLITKSEQLKLYRLHSDMLAYLTRLNTSFSVPVFAPVAEPIIYLFESHQFQNFSDMLRKNSEDEPPTDLLQNMNHFFSQLTLLLIKQKNQIQDIIANDGTRNDSQKAKIRELDRLLQEAVSKNKEIDATIERFQMAANEERKQTIDEFEKNKPLLSELEAKLESLQQGPPSSAALEAELRAKMNEFDQLVQERSQFIQGKMKTQVESDKEYLNALRDDNVKLRTETQLVNGENVRRNKKLEKLHKALVVAKEKEEKRKRRNKKE